MVERVVEVATGGNPLRVLATLETLRVEDGRVYEVTIRHDPSCPCLTGTPLAGCTCEVLGVERKRVR
jgi:hypothetical protein